MKVILIVGTYGSGTTALTGALDALGISSLPPHFKTNDERTPNSFESLGFRQIIQFIADENSMSVDQTKTPAFVRKLRSFLLGVDAGPYDCVVLKMPLASICLPQIFQVTNPYVIWMHRPFDEVEATRIRRGWSSNYGEASAELICSKMLSDLLSYQRSFLSLSFRDLRRDTRRQLCKVLEYCDLPELIELIEPAVQFIKPE